MVSTSSNTPHRPGVTHPLGPSILLPLELQLELLVLLLEALYPATQHSARMSASRSPAPSCQHAQQGLFPLVHLGLLLGHLVIVVDHARKRVERRRDLACGDEVAASESRPRASRGVATARTLYGRRRLALCHDRQVGLNARHLPRAGRVEGVHGAGSSRTPGAVSGRDNRTEPELAGRSTADAATNNCVSKCGRRWM